MAYHFLAADVLCRALEPRRPPERGPRLRYVEVAVVRVRDHRRRGSPSVAPDVAQRRKR